MNRNRALLLGICLLLLAGLVPAQLSAQSFADPAFQLVWQRTDKPVADGRVTRSWVWGPNPFTEAINEPYAESPGGTRMVQYFDKSRMEINDPYGDRGSQWFVTNGLLVREMVDGRIATGNSAYSQSTPSQEAVAGDPAANNPSCPTYATFQYLSWQRADSRVGQAATAIIAKDSASWDDPTKAGYAGTTITYYEGTLGHNVPKVFWDHMNQSGLVYEGGSYRSGKVVDWLFAFGYPITEPYWVRAMVAGVEQDVLVQLFERRVLTYTPANAAGWQVEMGNVGRHYYNWRYGNGTPQPPVPPGAVGEGDVVKLADDGTIYLVQNGQRRAFPDWDTFVGMGYTLEQVKVLSREQLETIPLGDPLPSILQGCQPSMALVRIVNNTGDVLDLGLSGPETVSISVPRYYSRNYCLIAGSYFYTAGAGWFYKSGTKNLVGGRCQCWNVFNPLPGGCECSSSLADYTRP